MVRCGLFWAMGCRQGVRHGVLIPAYLGSNPSTPANNFGKVLSVSVSSEMSNIRIFHGSSNPELAKIVADRLQVPLGKAHVGRFSDGEIRVEILENIRGREVFILQSTCEPTNDSLMELILLGDAVRRASAAR